MATTMIRAAESTQNVLSGHNVRDVSRGLHELDPDAAPFLTITTKAGDKKRVAKAPKVEWNEKGLAPKVDQANGAITTGATALVVDNAAYWGVNDIGKVSPTGEVFRVTAVTTGTNTLTISRAVGSTTAATIADNADIFILGTAKAEGAAKGAARSHQETTPYNYTEIQEHVFSATGTQQATDNYVGDPRTVLRMEKLREHKIDIERMFHFGERNLDATDTNAPIRYCGGLLYWLTSNNTNAGGTLTEGELETWLEGLFTYTGGGPTRLLLASPKVISVLDQLAIGRLQTVSDRNISYGVSLSRWVTSHGDLMIAKDRLLVNGPGGTGYGGYAFAIDPTKIQYVHMGADDKGSRDSRLEKDIQTNGDDAWMDRYLAEVAIEVHNPETMGVLTNVTA